MPEITIADALIDRLAARGVRKMFGIPGGDCNLDIIESGQRAGIEFVVTRTENSAVFQNSVLWIRMRCQPGVTGVSSCSPNRMSPMLVPSSDTKT